MPRLPLPRPNVPTLTAGLSWIDLEFLGRPHVVATGVVQHAGEIALIDPGPATCLPVLERELLRRGVRLDDVRQVLLTHIHLDHAGVTGTLVRRYPHVRVKVHERGAPHLSDPARLLKSAARLYGDQMDRLWGEVLPVPAANVDPLVGGETVDAGGRSFEVAYTPGHASHHVSYFDVASGVAFVGDTAGVCVDGGYVLPPTPPPDIDLELWADSVRRIERWSPGTLFMTHFGPVTAIRPHLDALLEHLATTAALVRQSLLDPGSDEERASRVAGELRRELRRQMTEAQAMAYEAAAPLDLLWLGLARYWRKRGSGSGAQQGVGAS
jgi:glyoxylase-like metal-dependent hydrolase (beta-lactamase superfamily II)